jgi:hypothetical protein
MATAGAAAGGGAFLTQKNEKLYVRLLPEVFDTCILKLSLL